MTTELTSERIAELRKQLNTLSTAWNWHIAREVLPALLDAAEECLRLRDDYALLSSAATRDSTDHTTCRAKLILVKAELERLRRLGEDWEKSIDRLVADKAKLQKFKQYVHDRLDEAGVPKCEEVNKTTGCRIGARLTHIIVEKEALEEKLDEENCAHSDEVAAHQETLVMLAAAKADLEGMGANRQLRDLLIDAARWKEIEWRAQGTVSGWWGIPYSMKGESFAAAVDAAIKERGE